MTTKLYTAAEARRIDIERGGEGKVKHREWDNCCYLFLTEDFIRRDNSSITRSPEWLPVTGAKPEQDCRIIPCTESENRIVCAYSEKVEQLQKELAEIKEKARWKSCKKERPTTKEAIFYKGLRSSGHYDPHKDEWFIYVNGGVLQVDLDFAEKNLTWKYEADL